MRYTPLKAAVLAIPLAFTASPAFADRYELEKFQMAYQMAVALRRDMGQIGKDHYMKQDGRIRLLVDEAYKACLTDVKVDIILWGIPPSANCENPKNIILELLID